ncbi:MAG: hypothetical protein WCE94_08595 [Candidatus Methanoperedens sp.]
MLILTYIIAKQSKQTDLTATRINASNASPEKKEIYETVVQAALKSVISAP